MAVPKYKQIINDLKALINAGYFKPGEKIYSEGELKEKYNVSNTTVVRALHELVREGVLTRYQGKGTYVSKSIMNKEVIFNEFSNIPREKKFNNLRDISNEFTKVISIQEIEDARIAEKLKLKPNNRIVHFKRLRLIDDIPWAIQNNYIAKSNLMNVDFSNKEFFASLSHAIKELYGINILDEAMKEKIKIEFPVKDEEIIELLQIDASKPVYKIERITFVPEDKPYEYIESFICHDRYFIEIEKKKQ